jgi:hypothetical protein
MRRALTPLLLLLFACGDDGAPVADAATADAAATDAAATDAATTDAAVDGAALDAGLPTACSGKPCLTQVDDAADWAQVADDSPLGRCDVDQESKFLMPATPDAALQETVYQDVKVHAYHLDFMREVFPEVFGGLTAEVYLQLVQRRATRQYWAGALLRVIRAGAVAGYAFDVIVDPASPDEQLTRDEVIAIQGTLAATFRLPLGYAPLGDEARARAAAFDPLPFPLYLPVLCPGASCPTPESLCLEVPAATTVCGHFREGRTLEVEHLRKTRLQLVPGVHALPTDPAGSPYPMTLIAGGELGPERASLTPVGDGALTVTPQAGYVDYDYVQTLTTGTDELVVTWDYLTLTSPGGRVTLEEPWLSTSFWGLSAEVNAGGTYDDRVELSSCTSEGLDLYHADATLADGSTVQLRIRHQEPMAGSGPLALVSATVHLAGAPQVLQSEYFQLVYAGEHHNWNNQFWVLFDAPVTYLDHDVHGVWIDEAPYACCPLDGAYTLDANLERLDTLAVTGYQWTRQ